MQVTALKFGHSKILNVSFAEAVERVRRVLQQEGFGVQSEINISQALREKLAVDLPPLIILGACNPSLAYKALQLEPEISLLLPCNVTLRQVPGGVEVAAIDAAKMMGFVGNPELKPVADEVNRRLQAVLESV